VKLGRRIARRRAVVAVAAVLIAAAVWVGVVQWRQATKIRVTLARAVEDERAGRLQEARDGYRLVRELDPANAGAAEGFDRTNGELERRQKALVEDARAREEAVKFMKPAVLEAIKGTLEIITGTGRDAAKPGQELRAGQGLETVGPDSCARIRYMNVVEMDLDVDTRLQQWLDDSSSGGTRAVALNRGALRVTLPSAPPGKALIFSTPDLEVQAAPSRFRMIVDETATRLLVEKGALRATRRSDGSGMLIDEGFVLECREKGSMSTQPLHPPGARVVADFDSHVAQEWTASTQSSKGSLKRSTTRPGLQGPGALRLEYVIPDTEMVWATQAFPAAQDWSSFAGLSFWFRGAGTKTEVSLELWDNREPRPQSQPERFWYTFRDDFEGWKKFDLRWRDFKRRNFSGTPDDGFTQKEMWGVCFIFVAKGGSRSGSCDADHIELIPPASAASQNPWTPIFDGKNLDGFVKQGPMTWRVENGAMVWDPTVSARNTVQTVKKFADVEIRIRFDVRQDLDHVWFASRQGEEGRYTVSWWNERCRQLKGRPQELLFTCRGESVSATLNGQGVPIEADRRPREGALQFDASGPGVRIFSIDYRELR
jgi:hypothetical protein